jgi:hypothetical protein
VAEQTHSGRFGLNSRLPPRAFLLILALATIFTLVVTVSTIVRLGAIRKWDKSKNLRNVVSVLDARLANTRQVISFVFYLFGVVLFVALKNAFWTMGSNRPVGTLILENFYIDFVFASNVFVFFLVLHSLQWFATRRVRKFALSYNLFQGE